MQYNVATLTCPLAGAVHRMFTLRGAPALSEFRLQKLAQKLHPIHPDARLLHAEFVHFIELAHPLQPQAESVLASLLQYGPRSSSVFEPPADRTLLLVVPRPGTISPWSSKATDIAHSCGLDGVVRLERGVAWYFTLPVDL